MFAKRLDEVAFVVEAFVEKKLVVDAFVIVAFVANSDPTVPTVVDEVLKTDCPVTVRAVAEALARVV
jgi:hypothetical protein